MFWWKREATLFGIGAIGYSLIEIAARGHTHWTMTLTGGACTVALYHVHRKLRRRNILIRCGMGALIITSAEMLAGILVNRIMNWQVWDYSDRILNVMGQICPRFSMYWFILNFPLVPLFRILDKTLSGKTIKETMV